MSKVIATGTRKAPAGNLDSLFERLYLPRVMKNGDVTFPSRNASILNIKIGGCTLEGLLRRSHRVNEFRAKLVAHLCTGLGLSKTVAYILVNRPEDQIKRMEENIRSIIDCILFFDRELLPVFGKELRYLVRKIIKVSISNVDLVSKLWKEFTEFLYVRTSRIKSLRPSILSENNFFKKLLSLPPISELLTKELTKADVQRLSCLLSTRNLVPGGKKVSDQAFKTFEETITSIHEVDELNLKQAELCARLLGRKVRLAAPTFPKESCHISLSMAGSWSATVREGGRASEILSEIKPLLTYAPPEDECIVSPNLPWVLKCPAGVERWRVWNRTEPYYTSSEFGSVDMNRTTLGEFDRIVGFDDALGGQILACAVLCMEASDYYKSGFTKPIPCRVLTVPEPGCKVRIVTTTVWWVIILQQPLAHLMKQMALFHPSLAPGLQRADQAWEYLKLLDKADRTVSYSVLSSDLKEATDALSGKVVERILSGFLEGVRFGGPLVNLSVKLLVCPRIVHFPDGHTVVRRRGIFMGEPLTKISLTLYNGVMEELAIRSYFGADMELPIDHSMAPWRAFAVGGDDHIAYGPTGYLEKITSNHLLYGSKISEGKHGISDIYVKYTERFLYVRNIGKLVSQRSLNDDYNSHILVDSIKMRLLSPLTKSLEVISDRNVSIGKGLSLGKILRWLPNDYYSPKDKIIIRERFFMRMLSFLPRRGEPLYYQILLPRNLGGFDLWLEEDLEDPSFIQKLPRPTAWVITQIATGNSQLVEKAVRILSKFPSSFSERGYVFHDQLRDFLEECLVSTAERATIPELAKQFGYQKVKTELSQLGFYFLDDLVKQGLRGYLFKEILLGSGSRRPFNTEPWEKRYHRMWDALETELKLDFKSFRSVPLSKERIKSSFTKLIPTYVYNIDKEEVLTYYSKSVGETVTFKFSVRSDLFEGLPNLLIPKEWVGSTY